ncbi:TetR family transcriptional regulator C-terminal domain-containing protein [Streptomyces boncukensis]|uniref:TetR family transcriptional regulator n=1 Tax=Streptomyces boncukensis TaxID=2711219 RepID=A0A6G4X0K5_9ACTN|nr:TetR/AcrR family transcriptional regulator [Streptomyces boncukensis]NGO70420.1 TetR family transcriptional regulator [Streptomyces boncukensis]
MPRTRGDHEARRREVSEAVWRLLAARGFGGLTLRAVAAELGATTGLLTYYFPAKRDLLAHALDLLEQRTAARRWSASEEGPRGLAALRAALLSVLPLTADSTATSRIWVSSWEPALTDPRLGEDCARMYGQSRAKLSDLVAEAQARGELAPGDPERIAAGAHSFVLGLVVQALFDAAAFPPERQVQLLDDHLEALARG